MNVINFKYHDGWLNRDYECYDFSLGVEESKDYFRLQEHIDSLISQIEYLKKEQTNILKEKVGLLNNSDGLLSLCIISNEISGCFHFLESNIFHGK